MHEKGGKCEINHLKSSGAMVSAGAVEIFRHSVEKYSLIYNQYLDPSDGHSSSFTDVVNSVIPTKSVILSQRNSSVYDMCRKD